MNKVKAGDAYVSLTVDNTGLKTGLKIASKQLNDFEKLAAVGVTVSVNGLRESIKQFAELESRFNTLQGVTGKTGASLDTLKEKAKKLGASTSWTSAQIADGMVALARLGQTTEQIGETIAPVMNLARGLGVDVSTAAGMVGASLNQFSLAGENAAHVADVIAKATNGAAISNAELSESLKYAGTAGAQAGQSLENVVSLVMTLRNAGQSAEQAGTAIRSLFLALQDSKKARAFGQVFKVDVTDDGGNMRDITAILTDASRAAADFGGNLSTALMDVGIDSAAVGAVSTLLRDAGKIPAVAASLKESNNYAADLAGTMEKGLTGSLAVARSSLDGLAITFGESLAPSVSTALDSLAEFGNNLTFIVKNNSDFVAGIAKSAAKLGVFAVAAKGAAKSFDAIKSGLKTLKTFTGALDSTSVTGKNNIRFDGVVDSDKIKEFSAGVQKAGQSAAGLSSSFAEIRNRVGDSAQAEKEFSESLQKSKGLAKSEADAVSNVARRVNDGTVSQRKFNTAVKAARASASALSATIKGAAAAVASMVIINVVVDAGKELYNWFNRSFERARAIREEIEKAAETEKAARRESMEKSGIASQTEQVKKLFENARNWSNMTGEEKAAANKELSDALKSGAINAADARKLNELTSGRAVSGDEIKAAESESIRSSLARGTARAQQAAAETVDINKRTTLNKIYGTTDETTESLLNRARGNKDETDKAAGKIAGAIEKGLLRARAVANNTALTEPEKRLKIAEIKKETRLSIEATKSAAAANLESFGRGGKYSLNFADKRRFNNIVDGAQNALDTFEESIDSAVAAIDYASEAAAQAATQTTAPNDGGSFSFLDQKEQSSGEPTRADFKGTTANDYQLGLLVDDEKGRKADDDAATAAKEKAAADRESAKQTAAESVARLKSTDLANISAAQIKNTIEKLKFAESMGVDVSDDRQQLREIFNGIADKIAGSIEVKTTVQSRVFSDAVGAAFSLANNSSLDCARQQLTEIRRLANQSAAQYQVCAEILALL